jgi:hypothetical protein
MIKLDLVQLLLTASMRLTPACFSLVSLALSSTSLLTSVSRGVSRSLPKDSGVVLSWATSPLSRLILSLIFAFDFTFDNEANVVLEMRWRSLRRQCPLYLIDRITPNGWLAVSANTQGSLAVWLPRECQSHATAHFSRRTAHMRVQRCPNTRYWSRGPNCWYWRTPLSCQW